MTFVCVCDVCEPRDFMFSFKSVTISSSIAVLSKFKSVLVSSSWLLGPFDMKQSRLCYLLYFLM